MINQTCKLVIRDLYSYDIKSCYPQILSNQFFDFGDTDLNNKSERNVNIGKAQIGNENLSSFLMQSADKLTDFYLKENNIEDEDIIITQRDGFIIRKMLETNDEFIKMEFRGRIDYLIISLDRSKYLAVSDDEVDVKGMPHKYDILDEVYKMFANLNFYDKKVLFTQMQNIKDFVLQKQDKRFFMIPKEDKFVIITNKMGSLEIKDESIFSIDDVDKKKYYNYYFKEFLDPIFLEFY